MKINPTRVVLVSACPPGVGAQGVAYEVLPDRNFVSGVKVKVQFPSAAKRPEKKWLDIGHLVALKEQ